MARFDPLWLVLALAGAGVLLTGYLTITAVAEAELVACAAGSGCDVVQGSRWSTLLGLPVAFWGLLTYLTVGGLAWRARRRPRAWVHAMFVALVGVAVSAYLQLVSVLEIEALCSYCIASALLITSLFVLLAVLGPPRVQGFRWLSFAPASVLVAAALVLGMHLHYAGVFDPAAGPEDPYLRDLAVHLESSQARFYGAYWCPACQEQKRLFAASAERLPYVECSPAGRGGGLSAACATQDITSYPTWIIDGQRHTGVQQPARLAELSGFGR